MADKWGTATDSQAAFLERVKIITSPGITNEKVVRMYDKWAETYEQVRAIIRCPPTPSHCPVDVISICAHLTLVYLYGCSASARDSDLI